jgi:hypothetical protein
LARDITGHAEDASALPNIGRIKKDMAIDVTPLLAALERRVRTEVVNAATSANLYQNASFPHQGSTQPPGYAIDQLKAAQINSLFDSILVGLGSTPDYQCFQMAEVIYARGLLKGAGLSDAAFDSLNINVGAISGTYTSPKLGVALNNLKDGDWADFVNANVSTGICPTSWYQNENVIQVGPDSYAGWPGGVKSYQDWKVELMNQYNAACTPVYVWGMRWEYQPAKLVSVTQVPGYEPSHTKFLNIPKLGQMIFNVRTGQTP